MLLSAILVIVVVMLFIHIRSKRRRIELLIKEREAIDYERLYEIYYKNIFNMDDFQYVIDVAEGLMPNIDMRLLRPNDNISDIFCKDKGFLTPYSNDCLNIRGLFKRAENYHGIRNPKTLLDFFTIILKDKNS